LDYDVLHEAGISATETVVVVTQDDKVNILSSLLAKRQGANRALALLNNMGYASLVTSLGVDAIIDPRAVTVASIIQHTRKGRARSIHTLGEGRIEVIEAEAKENSSIIGLNIADIVVSGQIYIPVIKRGDSLIEEPTKNVIKSGDRLVIVATKGSVKKIEKLFSLRPSYL
jgi:trk system potassium uptake protein TrkA